MTSARFRGETEVRKEVEWWVELVEVGLDTAGRGGIGFFAALIAAPRVAQLTRGERAGGERELLSVSCLGRGVLANFGRYMGAQAAGGRSRAG